MIHADFMNDAGSLTKRIGWPMIFSPKVYKTAAEFVLVVIIRLSQLRLEEKLGISSDQDGKVSGL